MAPEPVRFGQPPPESYRYHVTSFYAIGSLVYPLVLQIGFAPEPRQVRANPMILRYVVLGVAPEPRQVRATPKMTLQRQGSYRRMGGLRGVRAGPGSGPPPFSGGSFCRRPDSSLGGGVGQKLDDRPGDIEFTDWVCTGAEAGSGIPHSY